MKIQPLILISLSLIIFNQLVLAQTISGSDSQNDSASNRNTPANDNKESSNTVLSQTNSTKDNLVLTNKLSGKVEYAHVKDTIKELEKTAHYCARSAEDIIGEVERHTYVAIPSPGLVGGTVITPMPIPSGMVEMGDRLKPRKKWLDFFMAQLQKLQENLSGELVNLNKLVNDNAELETNYQILSNINGDFQKHYQTMQNYINNDNLDNLKIGKEALAIYDEMHTFEKTAKNFNKEAKTQDLKK